MSHTSIKLEDAYTIIRDLPFIRVYVNYTCIYDDQPAPDEIIKKYVSEHPDFLVTEIRLQVVEFHHYWIFINGFESNQNESADKPEFYFDYYEGG